METLYDFDEKNRNKIYEQLSQQSLLGFNKLKYEQTTV